MDEKLLSLLGLARRAGKVSLGFDAAADSIRSGKCRLLLLASDLSERTKRSAMRISENSQVRTIVLDIPMEVLGAAIGKLTGIVAVNDKGFAEKMKTLCFDKDRRN